MKAKRFDITCGGAAQRNKKPVESSENTVVKDAAPLIYSSTVNNLKPQNLLWPVQTPVFTYPAPYYPPPNVYPIYEHQANSTSPTDLGDIVVRYIDTDRFFGRGGKIRFYLRAKHVEHTYATIEVTADTVDSYDQLKQQLISTGVNPDGQLPILHHEGHTFCETFAIMRYLAKRLHEYGSDIYKDYLSDMIIDKLSYWTDDLMNAIREVVSGLPAEGVENYIRQREIYYQTFETLLERYEAYLINPARTINSHITWVIAALAATLCDDQILIEMNLSSNENYNQPSDDILLRQSPKLLELYKNICCIPTLHELILERGLVRVYADPYTQPECHIQNQNIPPRVTPNEKRNIIETSGNPYIISKTRPPVYMCYAPQTATYIEDQQTITRVNQDKNPWEFPGSLQPQVTYSKFSGHPNYRLTTS